MLHNPYELLWQECPEIAASFESVVDAQRRLSSLDPVTQQLVNVAIQTANRNPGGVYVHALMAKSEGATREQVIAAVVMNLHQSGLTAVLDCLPSAVAAYDPQTVERLAAVR